MQIVLEDGTTRELEEYELEALQEAQQEHAAEQEREGIFIQYSEEDALKKLLEVVVNEIEVPIADAVRMRDFYPEWTPDGHYTEGKRWRYGSSLWTCKQTHDGQSGWNPFDAHSLWAKVLTEDVTGNTTLPWEQPDSTNPYQPGDRVAHNGKTWVCTAVNCTWEPGVYGWDEVVDA